MTAMEFCIAALVLGTLTGLALWQACSDGKCGPRLTAITYLGATLCLLTVTGAFAILVYMVLTLPEIRL